MDAVPNDNELIMELYRLLLKDALRLYKSLQQGVVALLGTCPRWRGRYHSCFPTNADRVRIILHRGPMADGRSTERFFLLAKADALEALALYRKSVEQTNQLREFFTTGVRFGAIFDSDVPELTTPPASLADSLQAQVDKLGTSAAADAGAGHPSKDDDNSDLPPVQRLDLSSEGGASSSPGKTSAAAPTGGAAPPPAAPKKDTLWADFEDVFTTPAAQTSPEQPVTARAVQPPAPAPKVAATVDLFSFDEPVAVPPAANPAVISNVLSQYQTLPPAVPAMGSPAVPVTTPTLFGPAYGQAQFGTYSAGVGAPVAAPPFAGGYSSGSIALPATNPFATAVPSVPAAVASPWPATGYAPSPTTAGAPFVAGWPLAGGQSAPTLPATNPFAQGAASPAAQRPAGSNTATPWDF